MQGDFPAIVRLCVALLAAMPAALFPRAAVAESSVVVIATSFVAAAAADSTGDDLGPTSAPAWVPPSPVSADEPWEAALHLPGRIVSLPLSGLGRVTRAGLHYVEESLVIPRLGFLVALHQRIGLYALPASLGDRTGSGGALRYVPPQLGKHLTTEINGSTDGYNSALVTVGAGPARLGWFWQWRPSDQFFGVGSDSREVDRSNYAFREQQVRLGLERAVQFGEGGPVAEAAVWFGPREAIARDGHGDEPDPIATRFPAFAAAALDRHVEHLIYGTRLAFDGRHGRPHWSAGWRGRLTVERFDRAVEALAIRDAHTPAVRFTCLTYEAETGASFGRDPRTLRLAVRVEDRRGDGGGVFLIPDLARLGGSAGLAGFEPGRFHGMDLAYAQLSYIYPLAKHFEFDLHAEAGNVFDDLADARTADMRHSFGVALRPRIETAVLGSLGVDWSKESVRFRFSVGGVE